MTGLAITECREYTPSELDGALRRIIEGTSFPDVSGKTVLVKPNILSDAAPEKAITTDYRAIDALLSILEEMGARTIIVGDSPGTQTGRLSARASRIAQVVEKHGARLSDFREENRIHEIDGLRIPMASALDEADAVISFAKFKTHQLMSATGAVKNMFGTIPGLNKSPLHFRYRSPESFASFLMKVFDECHVDYAFIDAVVGMEGQGPGSGTPRLVGLMMGSANAYARLWIGSIDCHSGEGTARDSRCRMHAPQAGGSHHQGLQEDRQREEGDIPLPRHPDDPQLLPQKHTRPSTSNLRHLQVPSLREVRQGLSREGPPHRRRTCRLREAQMHQMLLLP